MLPNCSDWQNVIVVHQYVGLCTQVRNINSHLLYILSLESRVREEYPDCW